MERLTLEEAMEKIDAYLTEAGATRKYLDDAGKINYDDAAAKAKEYKLKMDAQKKKLKELDDDIKKYRSMAIAYKNEGNVQKTNDYAKKVDRLRSIRNELMDKLDDLDVKYRGHATRIQIQKFGIDRKVDENEERSFKKKYLINDED